MKPWTKNQLRRLHIYLMLNSDRRNKYIKKHHIFKEMGDNVFFQPRIIPSDANLIKLHNNIVITSNVTFVNHDITALMFRYMDKNPNYQERKGPISIGDNVFVGANSTILYDVNIGNNVIIGAGSLVNKDIPDGTVAAGVPCKVIGKFEDYKGKIINNKR